MRKIIVPIFLVLAFLCSCSERKEAAMYWLNKSLHETDPKKASEYLDNAITVQPYFVAFYANNVGNLYIKSSQYQKAIEQFNIAINLNNDCAEAYDNRAFAYFKQNDIISGCRDAKKACELKHCNILEMAKNSGLCR